MRTLLILLFAAATLSAQQIPAGTLLPAMLDKTLDSSSSKPGEQISAKLRQNVPLPGGATIKRNTRILGHVVAVASPSGAEPAQLTLQFDHVVMDKRQISVQTGLRALASMESVSTAQQPVNPNSGAGTSIWDWNMLQVGGQGVFNGQRIVKSLSSR